MNSTLSFEFFPPKTPEGAIKLRQTRALLYALKPEFCSVTYGAGGSTQEGTFSTVAEILAEGCQAASHFSCIGATRERVREQLHQLRDMGVKRLVALRGDLPSGYGAGGEFQYASDLVAFIRSETGDQFHIEVAAYPEVHPQAKSPMGGHVDAMFADLASTAALAKQGRLRVLATTSAQRVAGWEQVPALSEKWGPFDMVGWFALMAPAGTPADVIARVNRDLNAALNDREIVQKMATIGPIADGSMSIADVRQFLTAETNRWTEATKEIGVLPE